MTLATNLDNIIIGFGSESGNAEALASQLAKLPCFNQEELKLVALNELQLEQLGKNDLLLVVTSTFGDGEPPANAEDFAAQLSNSASLAPFQYAIFALGDVAYANFCQFGKTLDTQLSVKGAVRVINRVDADVDYRAFFQQWLDTVGAVIAGDQNIGQLLDLKVTPYSEAAPHPAKIISSTRLNTSASGVYEVAMDISGSGINYRAGDLLYALPRKDPELLSKLTSWFASKHASQEQVAAELVGKELRLLTKSLLRTLANKANNAALKERLKTRNKLALADYLYGRDLFDVLQDCGEPGFISLPELSAALSQQTPRAYSIASSGIFYRQAQTIEKDNDSPTQSPKHNLVNSSPSRVDLCIRDVSYELNQRMHYGTISHPLSHCQTGDQVKVFIRSNPGFHLADNADMPIIMIGAGTGIAPYLGFLQQIESQQQRPHTLLFFGERKQQQDFLYRKQLLRWLSQGVLTQLVTAFSQDQAEKYYVQHAMVKHGEQLWQLLQNDAVLYVCGSQRNLAKPIDQALITMAQQYGKLSLEQAEEYISELVSAQRYRRDLY